VQGGKKDDAGQGWGPAPWDFEWDNFLSSVAMVGADNPTPDQPRKMGQNKPYKVPDSLFEEAG
jgi:hypothetical protein